MTDDEDDAAALELLAVELQLARAVSLVHGSRTPDPRDAAIDDVTIAVRAMLAAPRKGDHCRPSR